MSLTSLVSSDDGKKILVTYAHFQNRGGKMPPRLTKILNSARKKEFSVYNHKSLSTISRKKEFQNIPNDYHKYTLYTIIVVDRKANCIFSKSRLRLYRIFHVL